MTPARTDQQKIQIAVAVVVPPSGVPAVASDIQSGRGRDIGKCSPSIAEEAIGYASKEINVRTPVPIIIDDGNTRWRLHPSEADGIADLFKIEAKTPSCRWTVPPAKNDVGTARIRQAVSCVNRIAGGGRRNVSMERLGVARFGSSVERKRLIGLQRLTATSPRPKTSGKHEGSEIRKWED